MVQTIEMPSLSLASLISDYAAYNAWANQQVVDWLRSKPADLMVREVPSSFSSLQATLLHIWSTQRFWLSVLQQVPLPALFRPEFDGTSFNDSLDELFTGLVTESTEFAEYVQSLSDAALQEIVRFDTPWYSGEQPRLQFTQHCMNHSTYHRGQLITIGRNLGLTDAPMTDYNFYLFVGK